MFKILRFGSKGSLLLIFVSIIFLWSCIVRDSSTGAISFNVYKGYSNIINQFSFFSSHADSFSKTIHFIVDAGSNLINQLITNFSNFFKLIDIAYKWFSNNVATNVVEGIEKFWASTGETIKDIWTAIFGG